MKKYLVIAFACFTAQVYSQETETKKSFCFEPMFRIGAIYPIQFGDHSLADAHQSNPGVEFSMSFFNFNNFRFAAGFDRIQYNVRNRQLVGNFSNSNYTAIYGAVSYEFFKKKDISIMADAGLGYVHIQQASGANHFGKQEGNELRIGFFGDYRVSKFCSFFVGAHYIGSNLNMETSPELMDYYGKATQVQVTLGLKIDKPCR